MSNRILQILAIIGLLLVAGAAWAQIPGYMGRKTEVMASMYAFPGGFLDDSYIHHSTRKYDGSDGKFLKLSFAASLDRVVSRRHVLSLQVETGRFGSRNISYPTPQDYGRSGHSRTHFYAAGFAFKAFPFLKRGHIAPIGPYFKVEFRAAYYVCQFEPYPLSSNPVFEPYNRFVLSPSFDFGHSSVMGQRILLDFGVRIRPANIVMGYTPTSYESDNRNIAASDAIKFHLGLGVLLGK